VAASGAESVKAGSVANGIGAGFRNVRRMLALAAIRYLAPHQPRAARDAAHAWRAQAWSVVRVEFKRALALRSEIRRAGWFN
jgi:hypothetical protein